jgi:outer membrane protease
MPAIYGGVGAGATFGRVTLAAQARGGVTVSAADQDTHWMRGLVFVEEFGVAPYLGAGAQATVRMGDQLGLTLAATYDRYFNGKGSTTINGSPVAGSDVSGGSLETLNLSAGLAYTF